VGLLLLRPRRSRLCLNTLCSVRIPRATHAQQCGYYEDRRPASNMDPYRVTALIASTTLLQ
jgi:glutamine synthetase